MESDVKYAQGNSDNPDTETQFHQAMKRPHALSLRTMGSDLSADNNGSRSNPHTATDDRNEDDGNDTAAETQPDRVSLLSDDIYELEPPPTQTPFTTMDNSRILESAVPRGRSAEIKAELDRLESIFQTPSNSVVPDDETGPPETPQRKHNPVATLPSPVSEISVVPLKDYAPSAVLLQFTATEEPPASASTMQPLGLKAPEAPEVFEKRSVFRSLRNLNLTTIFTSGTKKAYRRMRVFFRKEVMIKLRNR